MSSTSQESETDLNLMGLPCSDVGHCPCCLLWSRDYAHTHLWCTFMYTSMQRSVPFACWALHGWEGEGFEEAHFGPAHTVSVGLTQWQCCPRSSVLGSAKEVRTMLCIMYFTVTCTNSQHIAHYPLFTLAPRSGWYPDCGVHTGRLIWVRPGSKSGSPILVPSRIFDPDLRSAYVIPGL